MIYYFSGTGNSYWAAKKLAEALGEPLADLAAAVRENTYTYTMKKGEKLGFVFPIYAWAPPKAVTEFVKKLELTSPDEPYLFAVCTCGASAGNSMELFEIALEENGLKLNSGFSIVMPDNCITLFEAEKEASVQKKLEQAEKTLHNITRAVKLEKTDFFRVKHGKMADTLTKIVNPIFCQNAMKTKPFYVTDKCISCGLCAEICTSGCIEMAGGRPVWKQDICNMCLACLNRCPAAAIQYGKKTEKRGRYIHPSYEKGKAGEGSE